jgi:hypothetical protein
MSFHRLISALVLCLGFLLLYAVPIRAQEGNLPMITSNNVGNLALYADLGAVVRLVFVPDSPLILIQRGEYNSEDVQLEVWNVITRQREGVLDTYMGWLSDDAHYMLVQEIGGFSIWDLWAYQMVYRHSESVQRDQYDRAIPSHYHYFEVIDGLAYVAGSQAIYVIDPVTQQEVDRTMQWCQMPVEISTVTHATCLDCPKAQKPSQQAEVTEEEPCENEVANPVGTSREDSPFASFYIANQTPVDKEYKESNLRINYDDERADGQISIYTYDNEKQLAVWPGRELPLVAAEGQFFMAQRSSDNPLRERSLQLYAVFACRGTALNDRIGLYEGPGKGYQLLGTFGKFYNAGTMIGVVGRSGEGWWKLATGEWMQRDLMTFSGECEDLPEVPLD